MDTIIPIFTEEETEVHDSQGNQAWVFTAWLQSLL